MENKINIAKLLKYCPSGMELYCTMYDNLYFDCIREYPNGTINCYILINGIKTSVCFTKYGTFNNHVGAKCVIFPKGKTTWEGFVQPFKFKDGDVLAEDSCIFIIQKIGDNCAAAKTHCTLYNDGDFDVGSILYFDIDSTKLATEEEKEKLFQAIKDNGYYWNAETKNLERLIEPKFKVGDEIVKRNSINNSWIVSSVSSKYYGLKLSDGFEGVGVLPVSEQDDYELLLNTNKFDFTTLKPFDKVLCRQNENCPWIISFFGSYNKEATTNPFICNNGFAYKYCIPYEGNEHLLDTRKDCNE